MLLSNLGICKTTVISINTFYCPYSVNITVFLTSVTFFLTATLYTSCILVGIFINSSVPIFFEIFIETVYPVPEGITCGVVTFLSNLFTGLLLFFLTFYTTGKGSALKFHNSVTVNFHSEF